MPNPKKNCIGPMGGVCKGVAWWMGIRPDGVPQLDDGGKLIGWGTDRGHTELVLASFHSLCVCASNGC